MRPLGGAFGVILGVLGRSWRPLGRLGGVLTASLDVWECLGTRRSVRPFLAVSGAGPGFENMWSCGGFYTLLGPTVNSLSLQ